MRSTAAWTMRPGVVAQGGEHDVAQWEPLLYEVMRERTPRLLAYARLLTRDDTEAEDVLQDALVRSFSRGRSFADVDHAEAYVRHAIPSVFVDRYRSRRSREAAQSRLARRSAAPADQGDRAAVLDVRAALADLPPRERACIVLRFYDDMTVPQIAHALHLAEGSVKRYLHDASARLAVVLGTVVEWDGGPSTVPVTVRAAKGGR
ncbi:sigma-70 family RNA polymerase sigma factor [Demequina capsici]|uniref:Sigma-70 family RNA polymerase sigma factor n=1 Tax=Demequina capsici TaxID=3075620 RepID=A0AA96FBM0_9MICO|nr:MULTISPECIES: sigma-70 family RNA polymerase sigma factor [unclassified Demequina]WNM24376.1 sigma-70 family RNA polymerase sigma factor [Demequina sp. OYTSA14]WNM27198.1 sigma-70 family RNA polymerase sigma factor [Demequina sp. PMTSA13]